jgi:hypothetical protein
MLLPLLPALAGGPLLTPSELQAMNQSNGVAEMSRRPCFHQE